VRRAARSSSYRQTGYGAAVVIAREDTEPGTALLLAAAPVGKGCLMDASSVLPALAAVAPSVLTGTVAATVIELADPMDQQTVLTRIRAAATTTGPLSLYITGQLHLDHKQHLIHLALARTTSSTLRYTGLPWHWLVGELGLRRPGTTTVVVDLVADAETWPLVNTQGLGLGYGIRVYGRIVPPPPRRTIASPLYLKACAAIWRSGARPPLGLLHEQAAARAGSEGAVLLLAADAQARQPQARTETQPRTQPQIQVQAQPHPQPRPPAGQLPTPVRPQPAASTASAPAGAGTDPHPAILDAARAGRHAEAASIAAMWESEALRTHGPGSAQAIHWLEVRADLARLAKDASRSCELWMAAAEARLARRQSGDAEDVVAAVDRAHHQWEQLRDPVAADALAPALTALRRRVPGRRPGALQAIERRTETLHPATAPQQ
jgi:hypothetical protein